MTTWLTEMYKKHGKPKYKEWHTPRLDVPGHNFYAFLRSWFNNELECTIAYHFQVEKKFGPQYSLYIAQYGQGPRIDIESYEPISDRQIRGALQAVGLL